MHPAHRTIFPEKQEDSPSEKDFLFWRGMRPIRKKEILLRKTNRTEKANTKNAQHYRQQNLLCRGGPSDCRRAVFRDRGQPLERVYYQALLKGRWMRCDATERTSRASPSPYVPGSFEIPVALQTMAQSGRYDGLIALGCIIRGATTHYDHIASAVTSGISSVALSSGLPIAFGVITTESIEQAIERAGSKAGNKGAEAALVVVEMADLLRRLKE